MSEDTAEDIKTAESQGWHSDYEGDNKKSAAEFLHDGNFYKEIKDLKTKNTELRSSFNKLTDHYEKVRASDQQKAEAEYQNKIDFLKREKVTALDEGDNVRVVEIDEQIRTAPKPAKERVSGNPAFESWNKDNPWYGSSTFLRVEADKLGEHYYSQGLRGRELFDAIGDHVQQLHPEKFTNQKRAKASTVESATPGGTRTTGKKVSEKELTKDEREVFKTFKATGIFKTDEDIQTYLKQVMEVR